MSKYLYQTVYEEFTGLKPPEPTDTKQRRKRGYGHPYRMRLNMQDTEEKSLKKPERRNQFGQPINNARSKNKDARDPQQTQKVMMPQFNARKNREHREPREAMSREAMPQLTIPAERKGSTTAQPKVTYKKRRRFSLTDKAPSEDSTQS
ncbi:MAG: hypothetical protein MI717_00165 [Spirochaetales bacterium]|nr:hypothetical protein [Spirochaetales bacterium]